MDYAADRRQGSRDYQQDEYGIIDGAELSDSSPAMKVFVLADGMGGHNCGERASELAVYRFVESFGETSGPITDRLLQSLHSANEGLTRAISEDSNLEGMGTTLLAAAITQDSVQWVSVGDSKLRLYSLKNGLLRCLNADHSMTPLIESLKESGNEDVAELGLSGNVLRSAFTGGVIAMIDVSSQPTPLEPGDVVLLASDGLETLTEDQIRSEIESARTNGAAAMVEKLLGSIERIADSGQDNTTAVVVVPNGQEELSANSPSTQSILSKARARVLYIVIGVLLLVSALVYTFFYAGGSSEEVPTNRNIPESLDSTDISESQDLSQEPTTSIEADSESEDVVSLEPQSNEEIEADPDTAEQ